MSILLKLYIGVSCLITLGVFLVIKARRERTVSPINGSIDQNYDRFYREFSQMGYTIKEYEPLEGKQLKIFFNHPSKTYFVIMGLILLMMGILPGLIWFVVGRDWLSLTLKESAGFVLYIYETNNIKFAGKVWQKMNLKYTKELLSDVPDDLETIIEGL